MKNFKQLIKELPSNRVVAAFGQFQPPTAGHESLVKAVQSIAGNNDHIIYASTNEDKKQNPLPTDRKIYFLQRMFSEGKFAASSKVNSILEMAIDLNKRYKHLTVVTFSNRVAEVSEQLKQQNGKLYQFESIKVISAGETDPDNNTFSAVSGIKMCESAKHGDIVQFKKGVPHTLTELDSRRLMNDVRKGMGLDPIRENIIYERTKVREQYVAGKIFNIGDRVKDEDGVYEIMDRGANYITVVNESGTLMKKWIDKVSPSRKKIEENIETNPNEICFKNYTTANFHKDPRVFHAFKGTISKWEQGGIEDGVAVLNAIKHTDSYLSMVDGKDRTSEENKAKQALGRIGEYQSHNYWDGHKVITTDDVIAKHNADLQNAIEKVNVKEESEVADSKKVALRYKDFLKKAGSKEPAVEIAEPSTGKPMTVLKNSDGKLKRKIPGRIGSYDNDVTEELQRTDEEHDDQYEMAQGFKAAAEHSMSKGNMGAYHAHMANHHDHVGAWHERKGRSAAAEREYDKAAKHHEQGLKHPYISESFSSIEHKGDHKHITHGADFGFKVGKEHHGKIKALEHGDRHIFKCMDNNEYGCWRNGDNLHFKRHSQDGGIHSNMSTIIPVAQWNNQDAMGQDKPVSEESITELSTDLLSRYKKAAGASAKAADQSGNYKKGDKRFKGINRATNKQFDNDLKKHGQYKEDVYSSDTKTKKVQVQKPDGTWEFRDHKSHPHKINFGASQMNAKPAGFEDPAKAAKLDTETAYRNHLEKMAKIRADGSKVKSEAWVLNPDGKSKKKYKDIKDNKTLNVTNTSPPFDAFSNTNKQT
jgi:nicotinamide mononucleotide adenylyltransferase